MPRFRNQQPEQSLYREGDVVWVKIHNTEIWWPGEVTLSQNFRFLNCNRPPFAVVAFFNEKTFEQVRSPKLIYPFHCDQKDEFIELGSKKANGLNMTDKFSDDVAIAESRIQRQLLAGSHLYPEGSNGLAPRPDSLIKALLSSSNQNTSPRRRTSSSITSPLGRQEPTFRIMDIGNTRAQTRRRGEEDAGYECHMCTFRTNSMSVLLIHRRAHIETSSSSSGSGHNSVSTSANTSVSSYRPVRQTRAARRANTTNNVMDSRYGRRGRRSRDSTHFHRNSVRCHSRHVSIVVDASLTDEEQQKVASIAKLTLASIERVVHPCDTSAQEAKPRGRCRRSGQSRCTSPPQAEAAENTPRRNTLNTRDPRRQRSKQLRATMPAPEPPPAKQRRLTRSMSRRQQQVPTQELPELPPPPARTPERGGRRRTLAAVVVEQRAGTPPPPRRSNPMRKTLAGGATTSAKPAPAPAPAPTQTPKREPRGRKRTFFRHRGPVVAAPEPLPAPPITPPPAAVQVEEEGEEEEQQKEKEEKSAAPPEPSPVAISKAVTAVEPPKTNLSQPQTHITALELQLSLLAEWCDDEMDEALDDPPQAPAAPQPVVNGSKKQEQKHEQQKEQDPEVEQEQEQEQEEQEQEEQEQQEEELTAKKRIRNIPKKDRRDVVLQEFDMDSQLETSEEPILIQDSDASSNESVVFVEDEPRQRNKGGAGLAGAAGVEGILNQQPNGNDKDKDKTTSTSTSSSASPNKQPANNSMLASCFDFEEEEELEQEGQNGLSYRRRPTRPDANGKGPLEAEQGENPPAGKATDDDTFRGFEDDGQAKAAAKAVVAKVSESQPKLQETPDEVEPEVEREVEPELEPEVEGGAEPDAAGAETEEEAEAGDHLSLPIKERQKRIFKSRNKSISLAPATKTDEAPILPELEGEEEPQEELQEDLQEKLQEELQEELQEGPQEEPQEELQDEVHEKLQKEQQEELPKKPQEEPQMKIQMVLQEKLQEDPQEELQEELQEKPEEEAHEAPEKELKEPEKENSQIAKPEENGAAGLVFPNGAESRRSSTNSPATTTNANRSKARVNATKSRSRSSLIKRRSKTKTEPFRRLQAWRAMAKARMPATPPVPEELSNNSSNSNASCHINQLFSASNSNSNSNSNSSSSTSSRRSPMSPGLSSSNSCSIASNIAVISAEEARELQRSASGAGLMHSSIVDATQPVQRGGVLILEDIRLPNLYETLASLHSSDSNDSQRRHVMQVRVQEEDERTQDTMERQPAEEEEEEEEEEEQEAPEEEEDEEEAEAAPEEDEQDQEMREEEEEEASQSEPMTEQQAQVEELPKAVTAASTTNLDTWSPEELQFVPQSREVLLKKREQELLRQYEADLVSGRSAEKCRKARERWTRVVPATEEEEDALELGLGLDMGVDVDMEAAGPSPLRTETVEPMEEEEDEEAATDAESITELSGPSVPSVMPTSPARRPASIPQLSSPGLSSWLTSSVNSSKSSIDMTERLRDTLLKAQKELLELRMQALPPTYMVTQEDVDSIIQRLAAQIVPPGMLTSPARRPASHPQLSSPGLGSWLAPFDGQRKSARELTEKLHDALMKATDQLVDLRMQQLLRATPANASPSPSPSTPQTPGTPQTSATPPPSATTQRRPRRRSRTVVSGETVPVVPVVPESSAPPRIEAVEELSCELKDSGHESMENLQPPHLYAGRICAVMTRPIPGYNHTFMLCSLANNNFTPLNNVALYLDSEKNHLVPVPREALLEPPRLADGHPLSAVFADIDFLGGEAMAQVVETVETDSNLILDQDQHDDEVRLSPAQIVLSHADEHEGEPSEALGIMTPLSQVAEGGAVAAGNFASEEEVEELTLHEDQVQDNVLQLNVNGHRLELDPSVLFSIAEQPDSCIELSVAELGDSSGSNGGGTRAVLLARDILQAAQVYLQERDLQLVNVEDMTLDEVAGDAAAGAAGLVVPVSDLLSEALAGAGQVVDDYVDATGAGVGLLHIDTRTPGAGGHLVDDGEGGVVFISHALPSHTLPLPTGHVHGHAHSHLTPPITARTNETNALLDQTPIMSTLENPSGVQLRRVSPLVDGSLEDSLQAVLGVTHGSGVPSSLELPITVTNPAIAPRVPAPVADLVQFGPFH
ncbi:hypothetical protein KR009_009806 [Drosophila setifemur]|nr:hypothetical protein KR009_009806 [Drosophila setifemur]